MKLWQKVYLVTICLFVVLLNLGIYLVFDMTYQKDITTEQKRAESEYDIISSGITRKFQDLERENRLTEISICNVLEIYENYYANQPIHLALWKDDTCMYPKEKNGSFTFTGKDTECEISITEKGDQKIIQVQSLLYDTGERYYLSYEKELSELSRAWNNLEKKYLFISLGFSLGLAAALFFVLQRMMKSIEEMKQAVDAMGEGNLNSRILIKGKDDIAILGEHFNSMAEKIQENILLIQEESQAKQEFVDNFAHELKSPLTSIYGFAEYIQKAKVPESEQRECMEFIMEESKRLLELSYTLLDMAKMRTKEISMEEVSVDWLWKGLEKQLGKNCADRGVILEFYSEIETLYGNKVLLQSLLYNLVQNGMYACSTGGKIRIFLEKKQEKIYLLVEDNGCGMKEADIKKITEPFYRVDKARSREEGRTGLGLSLCREIVEIHKGEMTFSSEEQKGTRVCICFS